MPNKRLFYAIKQIAITPLGKGSVAAGDLVHGLQSLGINTNFALNEVFEFGQIEPYEQFEGVPTVELTAEKALDGYALMYHLATQGATSNTLAGRSVPESSLIMSIFSDSQDAASGTPIKVMLASGMFTQSLAFNFPVEGPATEQITFVANNKLWSTITANGLFNGLDSPAYSGGVSKRWHVRWEPVGTGIGQTTYTRLPRDIEGVTSSGVNTRVSGQRVCHVQRIGVNTNLGRDEMLELGKRAPYFRYVTFPIPVNTDIETYSLQGDLVNLLEEGYYSDGNNVRHEIITIKTEEGTYIDLGTKNKLQSVTFGGGNAGTQGGNDTTTYTYRNFNTLTVAHPADPQNLGGY